VSAGTTEEIHKLKDMMNGLRAFRKSRGRFQAEGKDKEAKGEGKGKSALQLEEESHGMWRDPLLMQSLVATPETPFLPPNLTETKEKQDVVKNLEDPKTEVNNVKASSLNGIESILRKLNVERPVEETTTKLNPTLNTKPLEFVETTTILNPKSMNQGGMALLTRESKRNKPSTEEENKMRKRIEKLLKKEKEKEKRKKAKQNGQKGSEVETQGVDYPIKESHVLISVNRNKDPNQLAAHSMWFPHPKAVDDHTHTYDH